MKENLICGKTPEEIEVLKQEHGALVLIEVKEGEQTHRAIFKEPTFKVLEAVNKISKNDELKGVQSAYDNCIVVADKAIEERDLLKIKAVSALMERVQNTSAQAKNL